MFAWGDAADCLGKMSNVLLSRQHFLHIKKKVNCIFFYFQFSLFV